MGAVIIDEYYAHSSCIRNVSHLLYWISASFSFEELNPSYSANCNKRKISARNKKIFQFWRYRVSFVKKGEKANWMQKVRDVIYGNTDVSEIKYDGNDNDASQLHS